MKKQIKRFSNHQTSKVLGLFYFILTAIILVPWGIYKLITDKSEESLHWFFEPFVFWGLIYLVTLCATWIYNRIAASFGGIEFELEDKK